MNSPVIKGWRALIGMYCCWRKRIKQCCDNPITLNPRLPPILERDSIERCWYWKMATTFPIPYDESETPVLSMPEEDKQHCASYWINEFTFLSFNPLLKVISCIHLCFLPSSWGWFRPLYIDIELCPGRYSRCDHSSWLLSLEIQRASMPPQL